MTAAVPKRFFAREADEVGAALIGMTLLVNGVGGRIVETESYDSEDPASHSFLGRRTPRNSVMYSAPGNAYVYFIYGMHWCLNFVCLPGSAVLIRALQPVEGLGTMKRRRGTKNVKQLCAGPGRLCQALAIDDALNGASVFAPPFTLISSKAKSDILVGTRIGLTKGQERQRRFGENNSAYLSRPFVSQ